MDRLWLLLGLGGVLLTAYFTIRQAVHDGIKEALQNQFERIENELHNLKK